MTNALTWIDGEWVPGNPPIFGPLTNAAWMATVVFDGARSFDGLSPDLDLHCQRCVDSAIAMGLEPPVNAREIARIAIEGIGKFSKETQLYVRPMFYGDEGWLLPTSTKFVLSLIDMPMKAATAGLTVCRTTRIRPNPMQAPTDAKASCLYPNAHRMIREAVARGYEAAVVADPNGNVAELSTSNLFLGKDGVVITPVTNGTFLNGITRQRTIKLLREAGVPVEERTVTFDELDTADELFATGNAHKIQPIKRYESRELQPGPLAAQAQALYKTYAETNGQIERFV
ncbi:MAG: branched-chain amino acid aminotransferase [Alphaproteobacteria bacterium]